MTFLIILIIVVLLSVLFRRHIKLILIKIIHGKYSYAYVHKFKKYANKSPFPYCFKDDILPYLRLPLFKKESTVNFNSDQNFQFEGLPFHCPEEDIIDELDRPDCFNAFKLKGIELKCFGYTGEEFGFRVKKVYFFADEEFILGEYIINGANKMNAIKIADLVLDRCSVSGKIHSTRFLVKGKNNNCVFFYDNGFSVLVRYFNPDDELFLELIR